MPLPHDQDKIQTSPIQILGTGASVPQKCVLSTDIDREMGYQCGYTEQVTGLPQRYCVEKETATDLACNAIRQAVTNADMDINDIDCIIAASGTMEQAIPYNAAFVHSQLAINKPIATFDINMTCLSSLSAISTAAAMLQANQYNRILIVSSDIASVGVDWSRIEIGGIFGDGAAAIVVCKSTSPGQGILASLFETHSEGIEYCQIRGGGTRNHPKNIDSDYAQLGLFEMQGKQVYKLAARTLQPFLEKLLAKANITLEEIDWVVPHQASKAAIEHMTRALQLDPTRVINIFAEKGNQVAASLPTALHELIRSRPVKRGDKILLIGTSAGLGLGGVILEY
jgi:3-oxoacyl-[acyl-carrier-protein] synthase-3